MTIRILVYTASRNTACWHLLVFLLQHPIAFKIGEDLDRFTVTESLTSKVRIKIQQFLNNPLTNLS